MKDLPLAPIKRLMKKAGAERVGDDAVEAMRDVLEEHAVKITDDADRFAEHAGRKTIQKEDVDAATR